MRETYVMRGGRLVPKRLAAPLAQANDPRVHVIGDVMDPMRHPATGRVYDSKARFRADTRAAGCIEVGTDPAARRPQPPVFTNGWGNAGSVALDIKRAIQELNSK